MQKDPYELFLNKFGSLTEIQRTALPDVEKGGNCLIMAPTGGGKTEAAILPVLKRICPQSESAGIRILYITPLRALNRDLIKRLEWLAGELGVSIAVRHGDTQQQERQKQAANPPIFLITTPESLQNLFLSQRLRAALSKVKVVIVDELHELYQNKRGAQLSIALERLVELAGEYQRVGISATIGNVAGARKFLCGERNCTVLEASGIKKMQVDIEMPDKPVKTLAEFELRFGLDSQAMARIERMAELIKDAKSTLVFANTRQIVESLGSKLVSFNKEMPFGGIGVHHSSLDKAERIKVENSFKEGGIKGIIATSSLELGIDIGTVNLVLQYGSPRQVTRLIQRIGRGGHREKEVSHGKIIVANVIEALESLAILLQEKGRRLESQQMEENARDVLTNQICAMVLEYKAISSDRAYGIIHRAAPYRDLNRESFDRVLAFAAEQRLVRFSEGKIGIGGNSREYFYSNISVIPDISRFLVKDVVSNKVVASLDEKFVASYIEPGSLFITKGLPWKVVSVDKDTVFVEQSSNVEAAVPDWEGEDIPITYETARMVFDFVSKGIEEHRSLLDPSAYSHVQNFVGKQSEFFTPSENRIVIEELENYAIIYVALGKLANELLARTLVHAFSSAAYAGVTARATPYAIIVEFNNARKKPDLKKTLDALAIHGVDMKRSALFLTESELFRYKFVQVAKLAGIVDRKATLTKIDAMRLIEFYKDSPIFEETIRDLRKNYLDPVPLNGMLERLREGTLMITVSKEARSPLGEEILKATYSYRELLMPEIPPDAEIQEFENRMRQKRVELLCTYCGFEFERNISTGRDSRILCPSCKSPMVCLLTGERKAVMDKKVSKRNLSGKDEAAYEDAIKESGLIETYGSRALLALSTYGVGPTTAARVLKMLRKDYKQVYIDLIEAQKAFIRNKQFWKRR